MKELALDSVQELNEDAAEAPAAEAPAAEGQGND